MIKRKRKTYILELDENLEKANINIPRFKTEHIKSVQLHSATGFLGSTVSIHRPDWEALGKPKKIRVTISSVAKNG